jgi:4'-phosphopantetheinyl transferase
VEERRYDVWWATVADLLPVHQDLLSLAERERRDRYFRAEDRDRFSLGAVLLRLAAARLTGTPAAALQITRTCSQCGQDHGKPRLSGSPVEASLSHSGDVAVVAIGGPDQVGIDVELVRPINPGQLAPLVLAPHERLYDLSVESFLRHWTRKEALVKATGDGLRTALRELTLTRPTEPPSLLSYPGRPGLRAQLQDLRAPSGYVAALAILGAPAPYIERDARALLAHSRGEKM